jgi:hypothetical protein
MAMVIGIITHCMSEDDHESLSELLASAEIVTEWT